MQDTTTSAMTEVALGLSMAFFTLFIVAMISMGFPTETKQTAAKLPEGIQKNTAIDIKIDNKNKSDNSDKSEAQFAFYFNNKFYDQSLTQRSIDSFSKEQNLIIAVDPMLSFAQVLLLRQQVSHPKLSITASNKTWYSRLQQMSISD